MTKKGERSPWVVSYQHEGKRHLRTFVRKNGAIESVASGKKWWERWL
jgi:hypothetical protein